jgi:cytochrome c2
MIKTRVAAAAAMLVAGGEVLAQEAGNAGNGFEYAQRVCAECHAVRTGQMLSPNVKATAFQAVANIPGMTGTALYVWLRTPHPSMPNLIIAEREQHDLIAYITSLKEKR